MKRFILILIASLGINSAFAQWQKVEEKADELLGTSASVSWDYQNEVGEIRYFDNKTSFYILTKTAFFNYNQYHQQNIIVGFYDQDDKLLSKEKVTIQVLRDKPNIATSYGKKVYQKIIDYIEQGNGYIRILANLYGKPMYDFTIPCRNEENTYNQ